MSDREQAIKAVLEAILIYYHETGRPELVAELGTLIAHVKFDMEPEWIAQLTKLDPL